LLPVANFFFGRLWHLALKLVFIRQIALILIGNLGAKHQMRWAHRKRPLARLVVKQHAHPHAALRRLKNGDLGFVTFNQLRNVVGQQVAGSAWVFIRRFMFKEDVLISADYFSVSCSYARLAVVLNQFLD
jgi:hypothetical protein